MKKPAKKCSEIDFGSYECYAKVPGTRISVDKCLVKEIRVLRDAKVNTIGCCCGHGKKQGYIQVAPEDCKLMKELGYRRLPLDKNGNGPWCFVPKTEFPEVVPE